MDVFQYDIDKYPCYKIWIIVTFLIIVSFLVLLYSIDYEKVYKSSGVIVEKDMLKVYCDKDNLNKIINNKRIIINNKNFAYKNPVINSIVYEDDYYFEILLSISLDKSTNIENNVVDIQIPLQRMTILEYILYKIGGD